MCWVFSLETGEQRPQFYPRDLPFNTDLPCTLTWDDETGLSMRWDVPPSPESVSKLKESMARFSEIRRPTGFAGLPERLSGKTKEKRAAVRRELRESTPQSWIEQATAALGGWDLPDAATALMSDLAAFHQEQGWTVEEEKVRSPISTKTTWGLGARRRRLLTMSAVGMTAIELSEAVPEEEVPAGR